MTEAIKWIVLGLTLFAGVMANYIETVPLYAKFAVLLLSIVFSLLVFMRTNTGQTFWSFLQSARTELRKVVWPTRQETMQVSIIVIIMVFVMSLILWGFDIVLFNFMAWMTGQGV